MKKIFGVTVLLLFQICFSFPAFSETIKIGYIEFPPMTYTNDQGRPDGIIIDIADKTLNKAGYNWTAKSLPAKRMAKMIGAGQIQLWIGLATLPEFKGKTYIGEHIVEKLILRAYYVGKQPPILTKEDLLNKRLLILRGYSYGGWINFIKHPSNHIPYIEFDSHKTAFERLAIFGEKQRPYYLLDYKHPSEIVLENLTIPFIQFNKISSLNIHFVITRQMENPKKVLNKIENAFLQLQTEGIFKKF